MNLTFQVLTRDQDGKFQKYGEPTEDLAAAADAIREANNVKGGPLYIKGIITDGAQSRTVYVNPDWDLGDVPVDWTYYL